MHDSMTMQMPLQELEAFPAAALCPISLVGSKRLLKLLHGCSAEHSRALPKALQPFPDMPSITA